MAGGPCPVSVWSTGKRRDAEPGRKTDARTRWLLKQPAVAGVTQRMLVVVGVRRPLTLAMEAPVSD
jgi:hypothetical protein